MHRISGMFMISVLLVAAGIVGTVHPLAAQDLRVVAQDASGMRVEYRPALEQRTVSIDGRAHTDLRLAGGGWDPSSLPGEPALPAHVVTLAFPSLVGNTVTVIEADYGDTPGVLVAPMPLEAGHDGPFPFGAGYRRSGWMPSVPALLENMGIARDMLLGTLRFSPVQWDATTRVLRVYSRIVVRVEFGVRQPGLGVRPVGATLPEYQILNSDMARQWTLPRRAAAGRVVGGPMRKATGASLASGDWFRFEVSEEGMYRLPKSWFTNAGIALDGVDPRTIRIYNSGGRELPTALSGVRPDPLHEIAISVTGEDDGRFDDGDAVVLYARGLSGFRYNAAARRYVHMQHRFASSNSFLVTFGGERGRRIAVLPSLTEVQAHRPAWFTGREFVEEEVTNILQSGKMWLSRKITPGFENAGITYTRKLEGIVPSQPVLYRVELWSQADNGTSNFFTVRESGQTLGTITMPTVNLATDRSDIAGTPGVREFAGSGALAEGRSVLSLVYSASDPTRNRGGYVNWVEWYYARRFDATGDVLGFNGPDTSGVIEYELNGFSNSDIHVYDVTRFDSVRVMTGVTVSGGTARFQAQAETGRPAEFVALTGGAYRTPGAPARVENTDLLEDGAAEAIIITPAEFADAALKLKRHRERGQDPIATKVVTVPEIYRAFNAGLTDPTAIRDFIAHAFATWSIPPRYVTLLGDGNYDYKSNDAGVREPQYVPVWESENSTHLIDSYVTDDYYVQVAGNDSRIDLAVGRLPAQNPGEAATVVDKIIAYENNPVFDSWRNRLTFVADDGWTTRDDFEKNQHTSQSEGIARSMPSEHELKKIYIVSYRTDVTAQGRRKPEAAQAIIDQINEGTVLINWTGHGSESVWAHEQVFANENTIPKLRNGDRLSFFVAATCTFGLYDRPGLRSGMEELMLRDDRGAIGGLTAPRVVFSHENSQFNATFLENLINRGRESDGRVRRIGDALWTSKQTWTNSPGYEKFYLMGDPALRLALPRHRATIDSVLVNGAVATGDTVQMRALSNVTIAASVRRPDGTLWEDFTGVSAVTLFDAERRVRVEEWENWEYTAPGGVLYRGQASVRNGRFRVSFIVPKDISYENRSGRFSVYFDNSAIDGAGYSTAFRVGGTDTTADADTQGPLIELYLDTRSFRSGDITNEDALLIADLADESGVNTTGLGIGHAIEMWLDGREPSLVLNDYYTGEVDSWQRGTVRYPMRGLAPGAHTLKLRAWDIHNNSSTAETHFTVSSSTQLTVHNVHAYPNPMRDATSFTFQHNQSDAVDVEVKIYTTSGHLIMTLDGRNIADRFVHLPWNGRDGDGDRLGNGVYFYKVICRTVDGRFTSEAIGKLSVLR